MLPIISLELLVHAKSSVCLQGVLFYMVTQGPRLMESPSSRIYPLVTNHPKTYWLKRRVINNFL